MNGIKKFEDFLDKMQGLINNAKKQGHIIVPIEDLENAFPELKESEESKDERIRKSLINYVYCHGNAGDFTKNEFINWLEKQGKQKSISITDEWIEDYWKHEKVNNPHSYDKGDEIQFDHQGFVNFCKKYCQKPTNEYEWSGKIKTRKVKGVLKEMLDEKLKSTWSKDDEKIREAIIDTLNRVDQRIIETNYGIKHKDAVAWLEKQGSEPNWCHHKVDLSNCSEEYCKAYYDGWNNCNMQHSQCKNESDAVVKCLINGMKFYYEDNKEATWGTEKFSMKVKDILSWLEKQCEQKPADNIKPKFKVGDFLVNDFCMGKVIKLTNDAYLLDTGQGIPFSCEHNVHLWTIQDAKDGDVLRIKNLTFIFQEIIYNNDCHKDVVVARCSYEDNDDAFGIDGPDCITDLELITPATKQQCDLLFWKMKEAGYEWNAKT